MVYEKIISMICEQFDMEPDQLNENTSFTSDMGIDSVDVVELIAEIEDEFGLDEIPEADLMELRTIGDLAAYVSAHTDA